MNEFPERLEPPAALEDKVIASLRARGLLKPKPQPVRRAALAAAAIALLAIGYTAGAWHTQQERVAANAPQFMLLLHHTPETLGRTIPEGELVESYRRWARDVAAAGHSIRGEKLKDTPGETLGGFFIIQAASMDAARRIADTCPHARLGGRIEIREIDPT